MKIITSREVRKLREAGEEFLMINTLPTEYFKDTKIPEAINIPQDNPDFVGRVLERAGSKDAPVIVYCANITCDSSTHGAEQLHKAGFTNVYDMAEGARGWREAFNEKEGGRKAKEDAPSKTSGRKT